MPVLKHRIEYGLLKGLGGLTNALPHKAALGVVSGTVKALRPLIRNRIDEACRRLETVFPDTYTEAQKQRIADESLRNITLTAVEFLRIRKYTPERIRNLFDAEAAFGRIQECHATGKGFILSVPHMGNWELAATYCQMHGIPIFSLTGAQKNPLTDRYINELRAAHGTPLISRGTEVLRPVVRRLKAGEAMAIMPDLRSRTPAVPVPFLGGTANIPGGMATFARMANVPILPCVVRRIAIDKHRAEAYAPIYPDRELSKEEDITRMTRDVLKLVDKDIRETPEQWFWFNKRWILDPI